MLLKRKYMNLQTERLTARLTKAFRAVLELCAEGERIQHASSAPARRAADEGTAWVYSRMCRKIQRTAYEAHHMPDHPDARPPAAECGGDHEAGA